MPGSDEVSNGEKSLSLYLEKCLGRPLDHAIDRAGLPNPSCQLAIARTLAGLHWWSCCRASLSNQPLPWKSCLQHSQPCCRWVFELYHQGWPLQLYALFNSQPANTHWEIWVRRSMAPLDWPNPFMVCAHLHATRLNDFVHFLLPTRYFWNKYREIWLQLINGAALLLKLIKIYTHFWGVTRLWDFVQVPLGIGRFGFQRLGTVQQESVKYPDQPNTRLSHGSKQQLNGSG